MVADVLARSQGISSHGIDPVVLREGGAVLAIKWRQIYNTDIVYKYMAKQYLVSVNGFGEEKQISTRADYKGIIE